MHDQVEVLINSTKHCIENKDLKLNLT